MFVLLAGGGLLNVDFGLAIWILITFVFFLLILRIFAWNPIMDALEKRETKIQESLDAAEKARSEAEQIAQKNQKALKDAEAKAQQIRKEALEEAEMLRNERIEKAKKEANEQLEQAKRSIEQEKKQALNELRDEVADLAINAANIILDKELDEKKNRDLVEKYIKELPNN